jgi:hypothetical protein
MFQLVYNTTCFTSGITTLVGVVYVNFPFVKNGCALYTCFISLYQNPTQKYCKEILKCFKIIFHSTPVHNNYGCHLILKLIVSYAIIDTTTYSHRLLKNRYLR